METILLLLTFKDTHHNQSVANSTSPDISELATNSTCHTDRRVFLVSNERVEQEQDDHIRLYLREIGQHKLLTKEDEVALSQKIERGSKARSILTQVDTITEDLVNWQTIGTKTDGASENKVAVAATKRNQATLLKRYAKQLKEIDKAISDLKGTQRLKTLNGDLLGSPPDEATVKSNGAARLKGTGKSASAKFGSAKTGNAKSGSAKTGSNIEKQEVARLLSEVEEIQKQHRFLRRLVSDSEQAETQFINSNLRLVVSIAKKYQASRLPLLDLIQEGNLGLIHAVTKFEWQKGFKFSTYATWWIRQAITRGIANTSRTIRLPVHAGDIIARMQKARSNLEAKHGRPATLDELAKELNMETDKVSEVLQFAGDPISLSEPLRENNDAQIGDIVEDTKAEAPDVTAHRSLMPKETEKMMRALNHREQDILTMRFGIKTGQSKTLEEVGDALELTRERVRQIEARAMSKLRHPSSDINTRDIFNA